MAFRSRTGGAETRTTRPTRDVFEATAVYAAPREAVWSVLWDPRTSQAIWPETLHSVVLPGTGPGVGEIHVQVTRNSGSRCLDLTGVVVDECRPFEFIRYRGLSALLAQETTEISYSVAPSGGTAVRWMTTVEWVAGVSNAAIEARAQTQRAFITTYLRGSGRILGVPIELDGCWRRT